MALPQSVDLTLTVTHCRQVDMTLARTLTMWINHLLVNFWIIIRGHYCDLTIIIPTFFTKPLLNVRNINFSSVKCFRRSVESAEVKWRRKVVETAPQHCLVWISRTCDYVYVNAYYFVLFSSRVNVRVRIRVRCWLIIAYAHVFRLLSVVILPCFVELVDFSDFLQRI